MKIVWITGRKINSDLAGTTELGLSKSLSKLNNEITIISPDDVTIAEVKKHLKFGRLNIKGLETYSGGKNLKRIINKNLILIKDSDIVLVDWRFIYTLRRTLDSNSIQYCIIDRGPPAYDGFIARIQKIMWTRSWSIASKSPNCKGGFVVSKIHRSYVQRYIGTEFPIEYLPAGTDISYFTNVREKPNNQLKIIYAGRVDKNRGMPKILDLANSLNELKIPTTITIIGEGDYSEKFIQFSKRNNNLIFLGKMDRNKVWDIIDKSHVGIMPMPNEEIWKMASPIKLSEYTAAGLIIIGHDHLGNKLGDFNYSLLAKDDWVKEAIISLNLTLDKHDWRDLVNESKNSAKEYDWDNISSKMILILKEWLNL